MKYAIHNLFNYSTRSLIFAENETCDIHTLHMLFILAAQ